jgi:hypothetical protein
LASNLVAHGSSSSSQIAETIYRPGIKYDLLASSEIPKKERARAPRPPKKRKRRPTRTAREEITQPKHNVVAFKPPQDEREDDDNEDDEIAKLKKQVRHAIAVLHDGKAVAAFNLLKRIVE